VGLQHAITDNLAFGRSVDEILRTLQVGGITTVTTVYNWFAVG
jgi:hypothetical protein